MAKNRKFDLEDRLIEFAIRMLEVSEKLPNTKAGAHLSGQLVRSGTSPALNYGEAQAAESNADFIHKLRIGLKELQETRINLKIVIRKPMINGYPEIENDLMECCELISIFAASIKTANKNVIVKK
ncbi:MAG: four helix bundle protein [Bacteroidetes bacterium]|nr:four helix bundle protein [Bacteroidota bacterium]